MKKGLLWCIALLTAGFMNLMPQTPNQALIFSIDVSRSMLNPPGFYQTLKDQMKTYIKNDVQIGDIVTIYSFGDDVKIISDNINFKITGTQDIDKLTQFIDKLQPTDNYTNLSKAIDIFANQMFELQKQYPDMNIKVLLFTDGKNQPPTGSSSLTLAEILNKHKTVFQNPYSSTYVISLGTKLDNEIQTLIDNPGSGIKGIEGDKLTKQSTVKILQIDKKIILKPQDENIVPLNFQFLSIQNVPKGSLKFIKISGTAGELKESEVEFNASSAGKKFSLPLQRNSGVNSGKQQLKLAISAKQKFDVTPKEVTIEIEFEEQSIEFSNDVLEAEGTTDGGRIKLDIKGKNASGNNADVIPILNPGDQRLTYKGEKLVIPKGDFNTTLELEQVPMQAGNYRYTLTFQSIDGSIKTGKHIPINLTVTEPLDWGPILIAGLIILFIALIAGLVYLFYYLVDKEFAKYGISGMSLKNEPLNNFKKFWQTKITIGTNIYSDVIGEKVVTIKGDIKTPFDKKLKLEWHNTENIKPAENVNLESIQNMNITYNSKYQFTIEKL